MLKQLDTSLWVDEVPFNAIGINFGNRMTCIQLSDNSFWLHSPNKFHQETHEEIKALGKIKYLVAPSLMHNLFIMDWKKKDPEAQVIAPARTKKVEADIKLDETSTQDINHLCNNEISCIPVNGIPVVKEYAFIHHATKTLILTDLVFNYGKEVTGWTRLFLMLYGANNKFGPTITIRTLIKDRNAFGKSLEEITRQKFDRIIMSHGNIVEGNGNAIFKDAFKKYLNI